MTDEEQQSVKHHLLGFVDPVEEFHIHDFQNCAFKVIEKLHSEGKVPVLVGGTHYYIESILWKVLVDFDVPIKNEASSTLLGKISGIISEKFQKNDKKASDKLCDIKSESKSVSKISEYASNEIKSVNDKSESVSKCDSSAPQRCLDLADPTQMRIYTKDMLDPTPFAL